VTEGRKFRKYFKLEDVGKVLQIIDRRAIFINVNTRVEVYRDPMDNFLLALAVDSQASQLTTGDKDLPVLRRY
jgi:putative PIN family toxin of toxin-antitoxin system